jgi:hypothetical protein
VPSFRVRLFAPVSGTVWAQFARSYEKQIEAAVSSHHVSAFSAAASRILFALRRNAFARQ